MINSPLSLSSRVQGSVDLYSFGRASCQVGLPPLSSLAHFDFEGKFRVGESEGTSAGLLQHLPEDNRFIFMEKTFETVKLIIFRRLLGCQSIRLCPLLMPSSQNNLWNGSWWPR